MRCRICFLFAFHYRGRGLSCMWTTPLPPVPHNVNAHPFICLSIFDAGKMRRRKKEQGWRGIYSGPPVKKLLQGPRFPPPCIMFIYFIYIMVAMGIFLHIHIDLWRGKSKCRLAFSFAFHLVRVNLVHILLRK